MSGEGLIADRPCAAAPLVRCTRQVFSVLARKDGGPWAVRLLLTGGPDGVSGSPTAALLEPGAVQIDLTPARADMLAQELMQMAELARNPGICPL